MSQRGLSSGSAKITPAMFATAIELRTLLRDYLQCDPLERPRNKEAIRALNKALKCFPLVVAAENEGMVLRTAREMRSKDCRRLSQNSTMVPGMELLIG